MIKDVIITKKKQIYHESGKVMHMLRDDERVFKKFGEIYFSVAYPYSVKAWHCHKKMTLNYVCMHGKVKLVLYDDREKSETKGKIQEIFMSPEDYFLVTIPPLIWNGFKALENHSSIIANCTDIAHDPEEMLKKPFDDPMFPYDWGMKAR